MRVVLWMIAALLMASLAEHAVVWLAPHFEYLTTHAEWWKGWAFGSVYLAIMNLMET